MPWYSLHEDCYDPFNGYTKVEGTVQKGKWQSASCSFFTYTMHFNTCLDQCTSSQIVTNYRMYYKVSSVNFLTHFKPFKKQNINLPVRVPLPFAKFLFDTKGNESI